MPRQLTDAELMLARAKAKRMAREIGKPVCLVKNRIWDSLWSGPARAVAIPGKDDEALVRDIRPTPWTPEMSAIYAKARIEVPEAAAALDRIVSALALNGEVAVSADGRIEVLNALADHLLGERRG